MSRKSPEKTKKLINFEHEKIVVDESLVEYLQDLSKYDKVVRTTDKKLKPADEDKKEKFSEYIHKVGVDLLKVKDPVSSSNNNDKIQHQEVKNQAFRHTGRYIKVDDLDADGLSIIIDNEWKTKFWSKEMIESACHALILIFSDPTLEKSVEKKEQALVMLTTLMNRHRVASNYVQQSIESMIGKIANKNIRHGRSDGLLDLIYILHHLRERFLVDLSRYNFCGLILELIMLEARLAAILIQNAFRMSSERTSNIKEVKDIQGFGDPNDLKKLRADVTSHRVNGLKHQWTNMRISLTYRARKLTASIRGVPHIPDHHYILMLEVLLSLVSDAAGSSAYSNREMVINQCGSILLSTYIAHPPGKLSNISMAIIMNISKLPESYYPLLQVNIINSCWKYFHYVLRAYKSTTHHPIVTASSPSKKRKSHDIMNVSASITNESPRHEVDMKEEERLRSLLIVVISTITSLSIHAAGIHRSHTNHHNRSYPITYHQHYLHASIASLSLHTATGFDELVFDMVDFCMYASNITAMTYILKCFLCMTSSPCQEAMIVAMTSCASRFLVRLVELLEESNDMITTDVLCLMVQCCGLHANRDRMRSYLPELLKPLFISTSHYDRPVYRRAIFIACALCRQDDKEYDDPEHTRSLYADHNNIHQAIYQDILSSMKQKPSSSSSSLSELVMLENDKEKCLHISQLAKRVGAKGLCDYFSHPSDEFYHHTLSWTEITCNCVVIDCLTLDPVSSQHIHCHGTIAFLIHVFHLSRYHFHGNPVPDDEAMLILTGISAAARALNHLCTASVGISSHLQDIVSCVNRSSASSSSSSSDLMEAACFFLKTLTVSNSHLDMKLQALQLELAVALIGFYDSFTILVLSTESNHSLDTPSIMTEWELLLDKKQPEPIKQASFIEACLHHIEQAGKTISSVLRNLKTSHGSSIHYDDLLDKICKLLTKLTVPYSSASRAHVDWDIISALQAHLPLPYHAHSISSDTISLSSTTTSSSSSKQHHVPQRTRQYMIDATSFNIQRLPTSIFELLANICQLDEGKAHCLTDGFLRRALEKLLSLQPDIITVDHHVVYDHKHAVGCDKVIRSSSEQRRSAVVILKLINCMANYHSAADGNANVVIFSPSYHIIKLCIDILLSNISSSSSSSYVRQDELIIQLIRTISILSRDIIVLAPYVEELDILPTIINELNHASSYPMIAVRYYVDMIKNIATGPRSPYLNRHINEARIPLLRLIHVYPALEEKIRDCNWKIADVSRGSGMQYRDLGIPDDHKLVDKMMHKQPDPISSMPSTSSTAKILYEKERSLKGTYCDCGVSSCGSLRLPDISNVGNTCQCIIKYNHTTAIDDPPHQSSHMNLSISKYHGMNYDSSPDMITNLHLPATSSYADDVCEISRLSAREKGLQELIEHRKIRYGYKHDPDPVFVDNIIHACNNNSKRKAKKSTMQASATSSLSQQQYQMDASTSFNPIDTVTSKIAVITVEELPELASTRPPRHTIKPVSTAPAATYKSNSIDRREFLSKTIS